MEEYRQDGHDSRQPTNSQMHETSLAKPQIRVDKHLHLLGLNLLRHGDQGLKRKIVHIR
jgi:hypothetical protein